MDDLNRIYEAIADERSRAIFEKRLKFSETGDYKYIREMVNAEVEHYADDDQVYRLRKWLSKRSGDIVVFGAGFAGRSVAESLADIGRRPVFIADNNSTLHGKEKHGIKVISPNDIDTGKTPIVVIGVNAARSEAYDQLISLGIDRDNMFMPEKDWWLGKYDQYFDADIVIPGKDEVFIDGGALDGCDSLRFMKWCNDSHAGICAIEPDGQNCERTRNNLPDSPCIKVLQKGLWSESTTLRFSSGTKETSAISEDGDIEIETISIDEIDPPAPITFIKMDIEGSEEQALLGAKETIKKNRPKLAICVYHKPSDITRLPRLVLDMIPDYKLYFRHYSYTDTETVMFAI